jgi:hypothetical protein
VVYSWGKPVAEADVGKLEGSDTSVGNPALVISWLGTKTRIVVVASGLVASNTVEVLVTELAHPVVSVTYLRTTVFVIVEYAVMIVLSNVGAFPTVMGMLKGTGVKVVFEVIWVTISMGWPTIVGAAPYSRVYCVRQMPSCCCGCGCGTCLAQNLGVHADVINGKVWIRRPIDTFMTAAVKELSLKREAA